VELGPDPAPQRGDVGSIAAALRITSSSEAIRSFTTHESIVVAA